LNNWNITNNHAENIWDRQRVMKWVQTRTVMIGWQKKKKNKNEI